MHLQVFSTQSNYKKRARFAAILWTLLIFILCFLPANEIPDVRVPLIDKWVHFILFGVFSLLWLCAYPATRPGRLFLVFLSGLLLGYGVECLQGLLTFLGRSKDNMDALADGIGSLLGVLLFWGLSQAAARQAGKQRSQP